MGWADREEERIERDYAEGLISAEEMRASLRDLRDEMRAEAEEAAEAAYEDHMGAF